MQKFRGSFCRVSGLAVVAVTLLGVSGANAFAGEKIAVVGSWPVRFIDADDYQKALQEAFLTVHDSVLPALQKNAASSSGTSGAIRLKTVSVGVNANASFKLGVIGSVSVTPRASLIFSDGPIGTDPNF